MEFAFILKNKNNASPVTILNVVPNDDDAETNIVKSRNMFSDFEKQASAAEVSINTVSTIDHNTYSGIARISRELITDIIIIGWPEKSSILDRIVGEKLDTLLNSINKSIFVCHLEHPLVIHKRIIVIIPPLAEREMSFQLWLKKISKISKELSISILFFCNDITKNAILLENKRMALSLSCNFEHFVDWEDFLVLSRIIYPNDLIIVVSARKGSVSYLTTLDSIPGKLEKHFDSNNRILIYPPQRGINPLSESYEDFNTNPLTKGIGRLEKLGKDISKFLGIKSDKSKN
jgi:hypothetical protein